MGLQFESLIISNRNTLLKKLGIPLADVVQDGPYFQTQTKAHAGCQIDYLVQTRHRTLYLCEIKRSQQPIGMAVVAEMEMKIKALSIPRNFSYRTIIIYSGILSEDLTDSGFFDASISIEDFF